jgi:pimeloyl-ACP methyl ester carboxylesterase
MNIDRGTMGVIPWAAIGAGPPVVVLAGVSPRTGMDSDFLVRSVLTPVLPLAGRRRLYALNRRRKLTTGLTMAELAAEHAAALAEHFGEPVDVVGVSTGGSIAQQLAAEHPGSVRRLVLISTGCRLEPRARAEQAAVAQLLRAEQVRRAGALLATDVFPSWARGPGRALGWIVAPWLLGGRTARADLATTLEAEDAFDLTRCTGTIVAPTLVVGGAVDRFYSPAVLAETTALIEGAELLLVPGRGHVSVVGDKRARARVAAFLG